MCHPLTTSLPPPSSSHIQRTNVLPSYAMLPFLEHHPLSPSPLVTHFLSLSQVGAAPVASPSQAITEFCTFLGRRSHCAFYGLCADFPADLQTTSCLRGVFLIRSSCREWLLPKLLLNE